MPQHGQPPALHCTALYCTVLHFPFKLPLARKKRKSNWHCTRNPQPHCTALHCTARHGTTSSSFTLAHLPVGTTLITTRTPHHQQANLNHICTNLSSHSPISCLFLACSHFHPQLTISPYLSRPRPTSTYIYIGRA